MNNLKRMLFRLKPTYPKSLTKLTLALNWLMDYISKCDVVLVVIKEMAPSKKHLIVLMQQD